MQSPTYYSRKQLIELRGHRCERCGHTRHLHMHHKLPRCVGGTDDPGNLELLCPNCHADAHDELRAKVKDLKAIRAANETLLEKMLREHDNRLADDIRAGRM